MGTDARPDNVRPIRASVDGDAPERREHLDPQQLRELFTDEDARWSSVEELISVRDAHLLSCCLQTALAGPAAQSRPA